MLHSPLTALPSLLLPHAGSSCEAAQLQDQAVPPEVGCMLQSTYSPPHPPAPLCRGEEQGRCWYLFKCKTGGTEAQSSGGQSWIRIVGLSFDRVLVDAEGEQ